MIWHNTTTALFTQFMGKIITDWLQQNQQETTMVVFVLHCMVIIHQYKKKSQRQKSQIVNSNI